MKIGGNRYLRVTVTPVFDASNTLTHLIALTRETTDETQQQLKVNAIHKAGDELADLTPEELAQMGVEERTEFGRGLYEGRQRAHTGGLGAGPADVTLRSRRPGVAVRGGPCRHPVPELRGESGRG